MRPGFSPAIFSVAFCCAYAAAFALNLPLFLYYPLHGDWTWGLRPLSAAGPAMAWYGLMADAGLAGALTAIAVPDRALAAVGNRVWPFACAAMLTCGFLLRHFFA